MFVPPSPSQQGDTPGSVRRPTSRSGQRQALGKEESAAERGNAAGRMVDKRTRVEPTGAWTATGESSGGGELPAAAVVADQEKPAPISLSEAKQVRK